jgi:AbrB family looped-hinge helix DNA binding protein
MAAIETNKMSSKGQIVRPEEIRNRLGLKTGDKFLVLASPSIQEFDDLIGTARKQAKAEGVTKSDITRAIARSRAKK